MKRWLPVLVAVPAALAIAGCATTTSGSPQADPNVTATSSAAPSTGSTTAPLTTSAAAGPGLTHGLATTCKEFVDLSDADQLALIQLIGDSGYSQLSADPQKWMTNARIRCVLTSTDTSVTVVDALKKKLGS